MIINLYVALYTLPFTIATCILAYFFAIKPRGMDQRCTEHTIGTIKRYSSINYSGINIPLVVYHVNGKKYKKAGPRFKGAFVKRIQTPLSSIKAVNTSNLTTREELPDYINMTIYSNSIANVEYVHLRDLYPVNSEVDVFYNPKKPKEAYIQRPIGINKLTATLFSILAIANLILTLGFLLGPDIVIG